MSMHLNIFFKENYHSAAYCWTVANSGSLAWWNLKTKGTHNLPANKGRHCVFRASELPPCHTDTESTQRLPTPKSLDFLFLLLSLQGLLREMANKPLVSNICRNKWMWLLVSTKSPLRIQEDIRNLRIKMQEEVFMQTRCHPPRPSLQKQTKTNVNTLLMHGTQILTIST